MLSLVQMRRLSISAFAVLLFSCTPATPPVQTVSKSVKVEKNGSSYKVKLEYPVVAEASEALNKLIAETALIHLEQVEDDPIPLEEFAKNVGEESTGQQWVFESVMTVAHQTPAILTTLCKTYTNTGAAHPNLFQHYEVYDLKTGKRLELSDLLETGKRDAIRAIANVTGDFPNEPEIGLLKDHAVYRPDADARMVLDNEIPYAKLKGILKSQYLP
jgi:hypothetical protein